MFRNFIVVFLTMGLCQPLFAQGDYLSIGIGPSLLYADNSGEYSDFKFKIEPAITLSYNKQITEYIGLRGSLGAQNFNSGDYDLAYPKKIIDWGNQDQAFGFKGTGYFADFMPVFTSNPNAAGMITSTVLFYAGLGFGVMYVQREQETLKNGIFSEGVMEGDIVTSNKTSFLPYVPIRTGFSTNLSGDWDFALEFVFITTTNSELDGNTIKDKKFTPDMSGQIQFIVKRYFGQAW